jgi:hypothetical protein
MIVLCKLKLIEKIEQTNKHEWFEYERYANRKQSKWHNICKTAKIV